MRCGRKDADYAIMHEVTKSGEKCTDRAKGALRESNAVKETDGQQQAESIIG